MYEKEIERRSGLIAVKYAYGHGTRISFEKYAEEAGASAAKPFKFDAFKGKFDAFKGMGGRIAKNPKRLAVGLGVAAGSGLAISAVNKGIKKQRKEQGVKDPDNDNGIGKYLPAAVAGGIAGRTFAPYLNPSSSASGKPPLRSGLIGAAVGVGATMARDMFGGARTRKK